MEITKMKKAPTLKKTTSFGFGYILCAVFALGATTARAELLSDLISSSGTVVVGGLTFSGFSYSDTGNMPDATGVNVFGYTNGAGDAGLLFQGSFLDFPGNGGSDAFVDFHVAVNNGISKIDSATLAGNPALIGPGPASMSVTETFLPDAPSAKMSIFANRPGGQQLSDSVSLAPGYTQLDVQKDILAFASTTADLVGAPTLSFFTQTFHVVPEPSSMVLFGFGVALVLASTRRSRRE